jgi:hypothetical protein
MVNDKSLQMTGLSCIPTPSMDVDQTERSLFASIKTSSIVSSYLNNVLIFQDSWMQLHGKKDGIPNYTFNVNQQSYV